jgi:hypothetical protein
MGGPVPPWPRSSATTPQKKPFFVRRRPGSKHRRPGLVDEDAVRTAQMAAHVVDDRHQVEAGATDPVAERPAVERDPLPPEDLGLAVERQVVAELRDDNPGDEELRGQPAGHDMLGRMRLRDGLRAAPAGVFRAARHQHPDLGRDHVQPLGHVLADPGHLAAAAGALGAGGLDHPLDPGKMRRQMPPVAPGLAGRLRTLSPQRSLSFLLRSLEHALGQFGIFERQVELVRRQLLGALAELLAPGCAQDILQPALCLLRLGQRRLDLGQAGFQQGVLAGESVGVHGSK